jgi:hypothetical protein
LRLSFFLVMEFSLEVIQLVPFSEFISLVAGSGVSEVVYFATDYFRIADSLHNG